METRKEIIKQMGDAMREDIFLEVNNRIERSLRRRWSLCWNTIRLVTGIWLRTGFARRCWCGRDADNRWHQIEWALKKWLMKWALECEALLVIRQVNFNICVKTQLRFFGRGCIFIMQGFSYTPPRSDTECHRLLGFPLDRGQIFP